MTTFQLLLLLIATWSITIQLVVLNNKLDRVVRLLERAATTSTTDDTTTP